MKHVPVILDGQHYNSEKERGKHSCGIKAKETGKHLQGLLGHLLSLCKDHLSSMTFTSKCFFS